MARIALISDIHANLEAFRAVLDDLDGRGVDTLVCLGDIVGYGPDPAACIELAFEACDVVIMGNHDEALLRNALIDSFNPVARQSIAITRSMLDESHLQLLAGAELVHRLDDLMLAHGSFGPSRFDYLYDVASAHRSFEHLETAIGAVGHTHLPSAFTSPMLQADSPRSIRVYPLSGSIQTSLPADRRVIVNPGSVGQPRDRNPMASWGILDTHRRSFEIRRVEYDVDPVSWKIIDLGLPEAHGARLRIGA